MREFSVPASFTVGEHDNIVSSVYSHEREDPDHVIFQRLVDGAWTDVTCAQAASQIRSAALGLIAEGVKPGDRVAAAVGDPLRMADPRLRDPVRRRAHGPDLRDPRPSRCEFVLADSGAVLVLAETDAHADKIEQLKGELPELRKVLRIDGVRPRRRWMRWPRRASPSTPQRSTTGWRHQGRRPGHADLHLGHHRRPKGCQLTHSNLVYEIRGAKAYFPTSAGQGRALLVFLAAGPRAGPRDHDRGIRQQGDIGVHQRHQEPGAAVRGVQADAGGVGAPGVREGLQHRRTERPQRRQGPDFRASPPTPRSTGQQGQDSGGPACCCGPSTRSSTGWSTASCAPRSAATAAPRYPAARRWARGSATSTAASG